LAGSVLQDIAAGAALDRQGAGNFLAIGSKAEAPGRSGASLDGSCGWRPRGEDRTGLAVGKLNCALRGSCVAK
jgi:hypothetical protein